MRFLAFALLPLSFVAADAALACGGLFCAQVSPTPVDQSAERILFEVLDDGTVAATVEIRYQGDPGAFSWIVPVGGTPEFVEVAPKDQLNLLDAATAPVIQPPTQQCSNPPFSPTMGCGDRSMMAPSESLNAAEGEGEGVQVTEYESVGPYDDIVVVEGFDPQILMAWLTDNGYQVTAEMRPYIEQYTLEGYSFLATRLQPNATVRDIVPIRFHCPMPFPEIPLRLTAIAAEPQMGFLVFVAAEGRYGPANYLEIEIDGDALQTDANGQTNYFALTSKLVDDAGGLGFVLERAQPSLEVMPAVANSSVLANLDAETAELTRRSVDDVLTRRPYLTRFYTRLDPDEMIADPQFVPTPGAGRFDGVHDLSARTVELCPTADAAPLGAPTAPPCGLLYCGADDRCAPSVSFGDGCICDDNRTARAISAPSGGQQVACTSLAIDLHGGGAGACASHDCGLGSCVAVNDRPTCACDDRAVAVIRDGQVSCEPRADGPIYGPEQILWPTPAPESETGDGCSAPAGNRAGGMLSLLLLLGSPLALRWASRRRQN